MEKHTSSFLKKAEENIAACTDLILTEHFEVAASRAYYAMFYIAEALLIEEGQEFSSHSAVQSAFGKFFAKKGRLDVKFHRYLIDAYRERQAADYDAPAEIGEKEVKLLLRQAREFFTAARKLLKSE